MPEGLVADTIAPFKSPAWLRGGHAQTIYPQFLRRPVVRYRRERVGTHDGDFWDIDWLAAPKPPAPGAPLVVLFHGLEGSAQSHYALTLMTLVAERGWQGVVPHFRGCGGTLNVRPRAYHSGDYEEVGAMLRELRARVGPNAPLLAVGVSLGGSALLNWLGREGAAAPRSVAAAAAVSVPLDLMAAGIAIGKGLNVIYTRYFLHTLKPKALAMSARFPGLLDEARLRAVRTMWDFDDLVTAPLHGFADTADYWTRASSKPWLRDVTVPTLVLNARNDPFVPASSLPHAGEVSRHVALEQTREGGHCGFMTGPAPGRLDWMPRRVLAFLAAHV